MKERVIQFGTGNFLRGFADYFIDKLNKENLYDGRIVVVSPTDSKRIDTINAQRGKYNLYLRGIENGRAVSEHTEITSISRGINPYRDFDAYLALAKNPDFRFIISNTTEAGIAYIPDDQFTDKPAPSFPGKLTQLLYARFETGLSGFVILACELIDNNGTALKECVLQYAEQWQLGEAFYHWIVRENVFCNTLVDRIVTGYPQEESERLFEEIGYTDSLLNTGELYHLWVIEGNFEQELPLQRAGLNVVWTEDAAPYKKRKVRVLNGAHTAMVFPALLCGLETVGDCLADETINAYLRKCLFQCILPVLGETDENLAFASAVLERFANPYIRHQLKAISLNSVSKFTARVLPSLLEYKEKFGVYPHSLVFSLACLLYYYNRKEPQDLPEVTAFIQNHSLGEVLENEKLWGADLRAMQTMIEEDYHRIETMHAGKGIEWLLSE